MVRGVEWVASKPQKEHSRIIYAAGVIFLPGNLVPSHLWCGCIQLGIDEVADDNSHAQHECKGYQENPAVHYDQVLFGRLCASCALY